MAIYRQNGMALLLKVFLGFLCVRRINGFIDMEYHDSPRGSQCYAVTSRQGYTCMFYSEYNLTTIPQLLNGTGIRMLEMIWISTTKPDIGNGVLSRMPNLESISFTAAAKHHFTNITFEGLPNLRYLSIKSSEISTLSPWLQYLENLEQLKIYWCTMPMFSLEHLCAIPFSDRLPTNNISEAPPKSCLPKLVVLQLGRNHIPLLDLRSNGSLLALRGVFANDAYMSELLGIDGALLMGLAVLDLHNNRLSTFTAKDLHECTQSPLSHLLLQNNQLTGLPQGLFRCLQNLEILNLSKNRLSTNPLEDAGLDDFQKLRILDLSHNFLTSFTLNNLTNCSRSVLSTLFLQHNQLTNISQGLFRCARNLEILNLARNNLTEDTLEVAGLDDFRSLTKLDLSNNYLSLFRMKNLTNCDDSLLSILYLQNNQLTHISPGLFRCAKKMKLLNLAGNKLCTNVMVDSGLSALVELLHLDLNGNIINALKVGMVDELVKLQSFTCNKCGMDVITKDSLSNSRELEILELSQNNLSFVHQATFSHLTSLLRLDLGSNRLTSFKTEHGLPSLKELLLEKNQLHAFPDVRMGFPNISVLNLNRNDISHFGAEDITNLKSLKFLWMAFNNISRFTSIIPNSLDLIGIDLSYNNIQKYPTGLSNCQAVNLSYNLIDELSLVYMNLHSIKHLNMCGNKLSRIQVIHIREGTFIEWLDLSSNQISHIDSHAFSVHTELQFVNLTFNQLHHLNEDILASHPKSDPKLQIYLEGNFLHCDCHNFFITIADGCILPLEIYKSECKLRKIPVDRWTESALKEFTIAEVPDMDSLYCDVPLSSKNHSVNSLSAEDFLCPYSSLTVEKNDCNNACSCYVSRFNFTRVMDCSSRKLKSIPIKWPENVKKILLNDNAIEVVEKDVFPHGGSNQLEELHLQDNNITLIDQNSFQEFPLLTTLRLHKNNLRTIDLTIFNETSSLTYLTLHDNPWECDCTFAPAFQEFIKTKWSIIPAFRNITCKHNMFTETELNSLINSPDNPLNPELLHLEPLVDVDFFFCKNITMQELIKHSIIIPVALSAAFVAISLVGLLVYTNRLLIMVCIYNKFGARFHHEDDDNEAKPYDVFIAHTAEDWMFVVNDILPELEETELSYKVCMECRDWPAGAVRTETIIASIQQSKRTILFVSESYFETEWCRYEFLAAHHQVLKDRQLRLIVVLTDKALKSRVESDMALYLKTGTYLVYGEKYFWQKLRYYLADNPRGVTNMDDLELLKV